MKVSIKLWRKKRRMTLEQLSKSTGISKSYLSEIEHNSANISLAKLEIIATALEVCPLILLKCHRSINCYYCSYFKMCHDEKRV
jgi:transcriptional regulator with XRE-family HTH domain